MLQPQPIMPTIVQVVPPPTRDVNVLDVLVGSLGLTGVIVLGSIVFGVVLGGLIIAYKKWRADKSEADDDSDLTRLDLGARSR
jgi:hypothetical protein